MFRYPIAGLTLLVSLAGPASAVAADPPPGANSCSGCHSASAEVQTPMPRLVSRPAVEIVTAMQPFRMGQRQATVMDRILIIALQAVTASASIGRLATPYYIVSRACNALALGAVAGDFAIKYFVTGRGDDLTSGIVFTHRADDLTGLLVFSVLALRTLLILCIGSLDRSLLARRITCAVTFAVCVACTIAANTSGSIRSGWCRFCRRSGSVSAALARQATMAWCGGGAF